MKEEKKIEVYNEKVEELYKRLETSEKGLTEEEAKKRLERDGENKLTEKKKTSDFMLFLGQFNDFMIILLFFASSSVKPFSLVCSLLYISSMVSL